MASGTPDKRRTGGRREHRGRLLQVAGAERRAEAVRGRRAGGGPPRVAEGARGDAGRVWGRGRRGAGGERGAEAVRERRAGCDPHWIAAGVLPDVAESGGGHGPRSAFRPGGLAARDRGGRRHLREANRGSLTSTP